MSLVGVVGSPEEPYVVCGAASICTARRRPRLNRASSSDDNYELHHGTPLGEWPPGRLKLARRQMQPKPIDAFVSNEAGQFLEEPR